MRVLDLFSGIGGFSLGLNRAGMQTVAFCEIDPFCRRVLAKHWPEVPCHDDIRTLTADWLAENGLWPDVICGGFPCQDISVAGKGAGISGERSGLWREYARLIGEIRPRYVIVENVSAMLGRGLGDVLGDLAAIGYGCVWHCIPASHIGAHHQRDRVWIVAYPTIMLSNGRDDYSRCCSQSTVSLSEFGDSCCHEDMADANITRLALRESLASHVGQKCTTVVGGGGWLPEPGLGRSPDGVSCDLDKDKINDETSGSDTGQILPTMWINDDTKAIQRAPGRQISLPESGILRPGLHGSGHEANDCNPIGPPVAGAEAAGAAMRSVRGNEKNPSASLRRESIEQRPKQHSNTVQILSRLLARALEEARASNYWQNAGPGGWEDGISRVADGVPMRVDRLKSLGNAVVPQIPELIGRAIMTAEASRP